MTKTLSEIILERRSIIDFVPDSVPPRDTLIKALEHAAHCQRRSKIPPLAGAKIHHLCVAEGYP